MIAQMIAQDDDWILNQSHDLTDPTAFDKKSWTEYKNGFSTKYKYLNY